MAIRVEFQVDPDGIADVLGMADEWRGLGEGIVTEAVEMLELLVKQNVLADDWLFRRVGLNSITSQVLTEGQGAGHEVRGRVWSEEIQMAVAEHGRRPGSKMPPVNALEPWVAEKMPSFKATIKISGKARASVKRAGKGTAAERALRSMAYVVARSIARKGIKARRPFARAADKLEQNLPQLAERHLEAFVEGRR